MALYHVALNELGPLIRETGLDPAHRAIVLLAEMPDVPEGFDVWEVDTDCPEGMPAAVFWPSRIPPESLLLACETDRPSFGM